MANIAVLVPLHSMLEQAQRVTANDDISVQLIKVIETVNAVSEARQAVENGASIIVARGLQAQLIKQHTNIPLVEIKFTGQELGLLIVKAKKISGLINPTIAFIGFKNLFSNMNNFDKLFSVKINIYCVDHFDEIQNAVEQAKKDNVDVIIGGDTTLRAAEIVGITAIFHECTEESIRESFDVAQRVGYARDLEKQSNAQLASIMDTSFNGIAKIGIDHTITMVNTPMEMMLGKPEGKLLGKFIEREIRGIEVEYVNEILSGARDQISTSTRVNNNMLVIMAAPIQYDNKITGAIFTFHKMKNMNNRLADNHKESRIHGYKTCADFNHILRNSKEIKSTIEIAKMYALSKSPVIIYGEYGTEKEIFAQAIHNNGVRKGQPFVVVSCQECEESFKNQSIFEDDTVNSDKILKKGNLSAANYGTMLINDIEQMSLDCQYRLSQLITQNIFFANDLGNAVSVDIRFIVTSSRDLAYFVKSGLFRQDLYYALGSLCVKLHPLRGNVGEIKQLAKFYIKEYSEVYSHYIILTEDAYTAICDFSWNGNLVQLKRFCERLILASAKRHIDGYFIKNLLEQLYPIIDEIEGHHKLIISQHPRAKIILDLLQKHAGNRAAVAKELGISTTTLWRHMKKFGVGENL